MNNLSFRASGNGYYGKTLNAFKIQGGKHLQFKPNSALFKECGITDLWYYKNSQPEEAIIALEDSKGNIIREFSFKQVDRIRNYFVKANAKKNRLLQIGRRLMELDRELYKLNYKCRRLDSLYTEDVEWGTKYEGLTPRPGYKPIFKYHCMGQEYSDMSFLEKIKESWAKDPKMRSIVEADEKRSKLLSERSALNSELLDYKYTDYRDLCDKIQYDRYYNINED